MTIATSTPAQPVAGLVSRTLTLIYGTAAYAIFFGTFLYAIGFAGRFIVPKHVNSGLAGPPLYAVAINLLLLALFAIQHSGMARRGFKHALSGIVSPAIERSTYVLCSSLALIVLFAFWQPIPAVIWQIDSLSLAFAVQLISMLGWLLVLHSTFLISHFELFGLKQVAMNFIGRALPESSFRTPGFYRFVRHPLYLGFIIAFWATPTMTAGHLLFVAGATAYIFIGMALEERDLVAVFGEQYLQYKVRVARLVTGLF
jgi:protein-S-isoprenylcysteine O-methyltransferase Ste14